MTTRSTALAGLTAHYRLDETSGSAISAQIGPAGSLTGTGNAWISGQITNAISFDGNGNAYVEDNGALDFGDPANPALTTNNNYTVCFWAYIPSTPAQLGAILVQKGKTGEVTYGFRLDATTGNSIDFFRDRAQGGNYVKNTGALALDTWHQVAGVFNRNQAIIGDISPQNELKVFVDGKIISGTRSSSGNLTNSTGRLTIGARDAGGGSFANRFLGKVDDVGVWSECLTYKKIGALYALGIYEGLDLSSPQIDLFVNAFLNQGSITIGANNWHYTTALGGTTIGTTGGTAGVDAYVVLDTSGNGMKIGPGAAPTLTTVTTLTGATEEMPYTITYAALAAAADEADVDSSPLSFIASKVYGTLMKNGSPVVPGVTLLSAGESWVWTPNNNVFGPAVTAFTVRVYDGVYQSFPVPVPVSVANVPDNPTLAYLNFLE
ncbi:MAG: LamG domain-containing protein, partial [Verrucomicrobiota bacterium]